MDTISQRFSQWWAKPFDANGDVVSWALFLVLVLTVAFAWSRILKHVTE